MSSCDIISRMASQPNLEPLKPPEAKALAREIVENGVVKFSSHAQKEMAKDDLATPDCLNVLRAGVFNAPEWENGELRYRVSTLRMSVVCAFDSNEQLTVVTAWRHQ